MLFEFKNHIQFDSQSCPENVIFQEAGALMKV